jgi:AraC-like DNA-binding protein
MKLHANHRTCPSSRRLICQRVLEQSWTLAQAAEAAGCSERTAAKWLKRYRSAERTLVEALDELLKRKRVSGRRGPLSERGLEHWERSCGFWRESSASHGCRCGCSTWRASRTRT